MTKRERKYMGRQKIFAIVFTPKGDFELPKDRYKAMSYLNNHPAKAIFVPMK